MPENTLVFSLSLLALLVLLFRGEVRLFRKDEQVKALERELYLARQNLAESEVRLRSYKKTRRHLERTLRGHLREDETHALDEFLASEDSDLDELVASLNR